MSLRKETADSEIYSGIAGFFSDITGLPIIENTAFPELNDSYLKKSRHKFPFTYHLQLGRQDEVYNINFRCQMTDEWSPREWIPDITINVTFNNKPIHHRQYATAASLTWSELTDGARLRSELNEHLLGILGGPNTEVAFMDYEQYSVSGLTDSSRDSFFANVYLVLMTHMKERGLEIPPILGKQVGVHELMEKGRTVELENLLNTILVFNAGGFDRRSQAHMQEEARVILERARWEDQKRDLSIPIDQAFPYVQVETISTGEKKFPGFYILVVENDLNNLGYFSSHVKEALEQDGRYRGATLIYTFSLADCMQLAAANRLDLIIFDWSSPSYAEALMVQSDRNPFFDMMHGGAQGVMSFDKGEFEYDRADGKHFDEDSLHQEADRLNIRELWMNKVRESCRAENVEPPAYLIIRDMESGKSLANRISQRLGVPLR